MEHIIIGDTPLIGITEHHLKCIAMIEGCCASLEYWDEPIVTELDNTMFSNTVVLDFYSIRKSDGIKSGSITFFFNIDNFTCHHSRNLQHSEPLRRYAAGQRLGLKSISFLIKHGYNVPL